MAEALVTLGLPAYGAGSASSPTDESRVRSHNLFSGDLTFSDRKKDATLMARRPIVAGAIGIAVLIAGAAAIRSVDPRQRVEDQTKSVEARTSLPMVQSVSCDEESNLHSLGTKNPTTLHFVNRSPSTRLVYWISHAGTRTLYTTLLPGKLFTVQTYIGHPWIVADTSDKCLGIYMPEPEPAQIVINW